MQLTKPHSLCVPTGAAAAATPAPQSPAPTHAIFSSQAAGLALVVAAAAAAAAAQPAPQLPATTQVAFSNPAGDQAQSKAGPPLTGAAAATPAPTHIAFSSPAASPGGLAQSKAAAGLPLAGTHVSGSLWFGSPQTTVFNDPNAMDSTANNFDYRLEFVPQGYGNSRGRASTAGSVMGLAPVNPPATGIAVSDSKVEFGYFEQG
mgnify:CR=1 FL=1